MINECVPNTVDPASINLHPPLKAAQANQNLKLALQSANKIGCDTDKLSLSDLSRPKKTSVLSLLSQILEVPFPDLLPSNPSFSKAGMRNLLTHPDLLKLSEHEEEKIDENDSEKPKHIEKPKKSGKKGPESHLMNWLNHHLRHAGQAPVSNLSSDLSVFR